MSDPDLKGRIALVTGGGRGIGRACCEAIAAAGADVAVNYHSNQQAAEKTAKLVESTGRRAMIVRADVSSAKEVDRMVADIEGELGPIDLLVNNAGIFDYVSHEETTPEQWQRTLDINLTGTYFTTWAVKSGMIAQQFGRIVNVASISALRARPMSIAYAVSKAGVVALTKSLAEAIAGHNIRVNAVAPGLIATEILEGVAQEALDTIVDATPIPRIGRPEEIAQTVLFLLSERSSFTTGQTLVASGGRVLLP
jgi:3-oxoacyl-[acyl-carrier protein] reductase